MYRSTRDGLAWAAARMSPGGIILCDDYYCSTTAGARQAVDEWLQAGGQKYKLVKSGYQAFLRPRQQAEVMS